MKAVHVLAFCLIAAGTHARAQALDIDGLDAFEPLQADAVLPRVEDGSLQIALPGGGRVSVAPWPAFLPQRYTRQTVQGMRALLPAGPTDRLAFIRPGRHRPWLLLASGARPSTPAVGNWRLQFADGRWEVSDGVHHKRWTPGVTPAALPLRVAGERWCVYLLDAQSPQPRSGIATEAEPKASIAAVRQARCRNPR